MKIYKIFQAATFTAFVLLAGCNKDFLNTKPITEIGETNFFNTPSDLELYVNKYYTSLGPIPGGFDDGFTVYESGTDMVLAGGGFDTRLAGKGVVPTSGGWGYGSIRDVNIFFANFSRAQGSQAELDRLFGEASFFRAWFYFGLLKSYGEVPIVDMPLPTDYEQVKGIPKNERNEVADFILKDLDEAIAKLPAKASAKRSRLNKETALAFKSRVALYEGTWEKYHAADAFAAKTPDSRRYLEAARDAAKQLIDMGSANIYGTSMTDFKRMYISADLSDNLEVLLWKQYSPALGITNRVQNYKLNPLNAGASKQFVEAFLCIDGRPIKYNGGAANPLYQGDTNLVKVIENRDPRLNLAISVPGQPLTATQNFVQPQLDGANEFRDVTGYRITKAYDPSLPTTIVDPVSYGVVLFRYAEVLLNYAEARAELGELTQADLDITINRLRARATKDGNRLPDLTIAGTGVTDDNPEFSTWVSSPIIGEIRRERIAELALEGFRRDDVLRWATAERIFVNGYRPRGMKYIGTPTQAYFQQTNPSFNQSSVNNDGNGLNLDEQGYIDPYRRAIPEGYTFNRGRDYLSPLSINDMNLGGYEQNPGWQ